MTTKRLQCSVASALCVLVAIVLMSCRSETASNRPATRTPAMTSTTEPSVKVGIGRALGFTFAPALNGRRASEVRLDNTACVSCHQSDSHTMHETSVQVSCIDCHGGNKAVKFPDALLAMFSDEAKAADGYKMAVAAQQGAFDTLKRTEPAKYLAFQQASHVHARHAELWESSGNPQIATTALLGESPDFVRFVNPGDLRAAQVACADCHAEQTRNVPTSMMAHGAMLWGAAMYNNGSHNSKTPIFGEGHAANGQPALITPATRPTQRQVDLRGLLVELSPLGRWEVSQPGNVLRVFERGGRLRPAVGIPDVGEDPGRPDVKLSVRGYGTDVRTDPVAIGLQKTRLLDPTLNLIGTNDHPGDYRSSGCSACHVVYANDRSSVHSARWSEYGSLGKSFSTDSAVNPSRRTSTTSPVNPIAHLSTEGNLKLDLTNPGLSSADSGHPIEHKFVRAMPTSTCIVCHIHPGTNVLNSYLGYMWWDNESDAKFMYPKQQKNPTPQDEYRTQTHNPEGSAVKGLWSNLYPGERSHAGETASKDFLQQLGETGPDSLNARLQRTQFADFHGHGWVFRAVFKQDRHGRMLDYRGQPVSVVNAKTMRAGIDYASAPRAQDEAVKPPPENVPVHLKDIHLERGMQCVDCHFSQDSHGDGNLYGETRNAVMVQCQDCHGDIGKKANILTLLDPNETKNDERSRDLLGHSFSGNTVPKNPSEAQLNDYQKTIDTHFQAVDGKLWQKAAVAPKDPKDRGKGWWVPQTAALNAKSEKLSERLGEYAHNVKKTPTTLAHASESMNCYACHSSWNTSCFGCHLPQRANQRKPMLHNEAVTTRNFTNYNYQTLRDDVYMLGIDSSVKGNKIVPIRSACAVMVSSQDVNRQSIYTQQQTISAEGYAGTAFSPYFPHTVRATETKQCGDCHVTRDDKGHVDNNAVMAQLLLQGTNSVNFIGKWAWVAGGAGGVEAVAVTESAEPQAVIGSTLHHWAYPDNFKAHGQRDQNLTEAHRHDGDVVDVQLRGEYLYAACGKDGFIAYDVANIDNKGFSERIITAPVSPVGQRFYVKSKDATSICSPSTLALDPTRPRAPENLEGRITPAGKPQEVIEQRGIHPLYAFLYLTDREEGLIVIGGADKSKPGGGGVATLLDGDPSNNFLDRATLADGRTAFNPKGMLKGATRMTLYGHHALISADAGIVVLNLDNPLAPKVINVVSAGVSKPGRIACQFRYAFVTDAQGLKVFRVEDLLVPMGSAKPAEPGFGKPVATIKLADARDVYVSRTYAYVAAGKDGLAIIDVEKPEAPELKQLFNQNGLNDATAVRIGMTNSSLFAYVADGRNGLAVLQLTSPDDDTTFGGFSPLPKPRLVSRFKTRGPAVALSEGIDRDRAVDEDGHQLSVFGRKGARPFTKEEAQRMYMKNGELFTVPSKLADMVPNEAPAAPDAAKPDAAKPEEPKSRRPMKRDDDDK